MRALSRIFKVALGLALAALLLVAAGALVLGELLSRPMPSRVGTSPWSNRTIEVELAVPGGRVVRGWYVAPPQAPRGSVLILHGIAANRRKMVSRANFVLGEGYAALLMDLHAHGESDGDRITFGHLEAEGVVAALDYLKRRSPKLPRAVIGVSLGGAAVLLAPQPLEVDAIVLEAVYSDIEAAIANRVRMRIGWLEPMFSPLLSLQLRPRIGVDSEELRPIEHINKVKAPVLVLAGSNDEHTTLDESERMFARAAEPKDLVVFAEAPHTDFHSYDRALYERSVARFLAQHLE